MEKVEAIMQATVPTIRIGKLTWQRAGWACLLLLACLLWAPELRMLWDQWRGNAALSHGPLIPLIAAFHLWMRRSELRRWESASREGLAALALTTLVYIAAVWADIDFLIPLALVGMLAAGIWFLGGRKALAVSAGALGFLIFMIPWPTTITDRFGFPLQMMSSSYAAMFGGLLGLPVQQQGVNLYVGPDKAPVYQCIVAVQCSGLNSLLVLLALGYLIAYHTPVSLGWRAAMVAIMPPLALMTNTIRIVFILMAGAYISPRFANWVHNHEGPVLIFLCSFALLGIRHAILTWTQPRRPDRTAEPPQARPPEEGPTDAPLPIIDP